MGRFICFVCNEPINDTEFEGESPKHLICVKCKRELDKRFDELIEASNRLKGDGKSGNRGISRTTRLQDNDK
jgi:hypothetical protein